MMVENVVTVSFAVDSEAYQALSELKKNTANGNYIISQISLVKNNQGHITAEDGFDTGVETADDTATGGLVGSLVGILGGPIGVILGGSMGLLVGGLMDTGDAVQNASLIEKVCEGVPEGRAALIALVQEEGNYAFDRNFDKYETTISRQDAAEVAAEVEKAQELAREMAKNARKKLREDKWEERKQKAEAKSDELKAKFKAFMEKHFPQ